MIRGLLDRLATWILVSLARAKWGLPVGLMPVIVERLGPFGAIRWMATNLPKYERMIKDMGAIRGHLACVFVSLLNGCSYCAWTHSRAFQLHFFQQRGALFPMDENEMVSLIGLPDAKLAEGLRGAFETVKMGDAAELFDRIVGLKYRGEEPAGVEGAHLAHTVKMFEVLNYCGVSREVPVDGAHDPLNKDQELQRRYAEARLAEGPRRRSGEPANGSGTTTAG